jgi:uncharacterized protein YjbI with pentapeptide repeats
MSLWRIRVAMSDDWRSQEHLAQALAGKRVCSSLTSPRGTGITVDMTVELADVNGLGALLSELHAISRQVLVSSAEPSSSPAGMTATGERVRASRPAPASLSRAQLSQAQLSRAQLSQAQLTQAQFS